MADRRRAKGSGSIAYRRAEHRYRGQLQRDGRTYYVYAPSREACERELRTLAVRLEKGERPGSRLLTVADWLALWQAEYVAVQLRPRTVESYRQITSQHIVPWIGKRRLAALTAADVQQMVNRVAVGHSPRTVAYVRAVLRKALNHAMRWDLVSRNVATLVDVPRPARAEIQPLTPEQARTLIARCEDEPMGAVYIVAVSCGLRLGEILGLRWGPLGVDLEAGRLRVSASLQRVGGAYVLAEPKTERSKRELVLPAIALAALKRQRTAQIEARLAADRWADPWDLVFTRANGAPLYQAGVTHRLHVILADAGLPQQRFHDLRHACASLLFAMGASPKDVMDTLGHSQIALTANLYGHMYDRRRVEVAERMDQALGGAG